MSSEGPEFIYDEQERAIRMEYDGKSVITYSDVDRDEYEFFVSVDDFITESTTLIDDLAEVMVKQVGQLREDILLNSLGNFQQRAIKDYKQCLEFQDKLTNHDSTVINDILTLVYKQEKLLKHYFRFLSIAQSLAVSYQLGFKSLLADSPVYLYPLVRNVCSTIEYLGQAVENRLGNGHIDIEKTGQNAVSVYMELSSQGLLDPQVDSDKFALEDTEVIVPPRNVTIPLSDLAISEKSMQWLWKKRCEIVHTPPLIVGDENTDALPEDLKSSYILTTDDQRMLTELSFRVHIHSTLLFIKYIFHYLQSMVPGMVEIIYPEDYDN